MYDMPLRDYDTAIGRWVVQDPVIHNSQSTYSSFSGNPVLFADPTGGKGQMLDENGANMFDNNGNYIWRADRAVPGEVSMAAYGNSGSGATTAPTAEDLKKNEGILVISTVEELLAFKKSNPDVIWGDIDPKKKKKKKSKEQRKNSSKPPKVNYKRLFATLKSKSLFSRATDLIAFGITGQYRHLFGPDAVALSVNGNASVGAVAKVEGGVLIVLDGADNGEEYLYQDFGIGAGMASAAVNVSVTSLYFSGTGNFKHDVFLGLRYEANVGGDFGVGIGLTGIYAPLSNGEFVIGFGSSVGFGISATIIDGNLNYGQTSRLTPWKK